MGQILDFLRSDLSTYWLAVVVLSALFRSGVYFYLHTTIANENAQKGNTDSVYHVN